jgi:hypothetical protein
VVLGAVGEEEGVHAIEVGELGGGGAGGFGRGEGGAILLGVMPGLA